VDDVESAACRVAAIVLAADALARRCPEGGPEADARRARLRWAAEAGRARLLDLAAEPSDSGDGARSS
jgi:hypothetical protein